MRITCLLLVLASCTQFPELDQATPAGVKASGTPGFMATSELERLSQPVIQPAFLGPLSARAANVQAQTGIGIQTGLPPRVTNLQNRAARLRRPVLSPADRARLSRRG